MDKPISVGEFPNIKSRGERDDRNTEFDQKIWSDKGCQ
jgi:hypothetical protein